MSTFGREKMMAAFFDGKNDERIEAICPAPGQTFREAAQERADEIASKRKGGCGVCWCWDERSMAYRENHIQ